MVSLISIGMVEEYHFGLVLHPDFFSLGMESLASRVTNVDSTLLSPFSGPNKWTNFYHYVGNWSFQRVRMTLSGSEGGGNHRLNRATWFISQAGDVLWPSF